MGEQLQGWRESRALASCYYCADILVFWYRSECQKQELQVSCGGESGRSSIWKDFKESKKLEWGRRRREGSRLALLTKLFRYCFSSRIKRGHYLCWILENLRQHLTKQVWKVLTILNCYGWSILKYRLSLSDGWSWRLFLLWPSG